MAKFVIECPECGKYAEGKTGFFARKKIDCSCGNLINIRTDKMLGRECPHCKNMVVFDQTKGAKAKCPVCGESINTLAEQSKMEEFSCGQCGVRLLAAKGASRFTCPVCDCDNDVQERLMKEKIQKDGLASIIKFEGDADTLVWKHPIEDFNYGSQLIVHESQEAIFFRDGQALDLFGAGRYTLETQQLPLLEKLYALPTDTEGTFHSEVYYISKTNQLALKWGTPEKVTLIDPLSDAPMAIGARGILNFRVSDSRRMLLKLVGTTSGLKREDILGGGNGPIQSYFRSVVQTGVSTYLANCIRENSIDILQIDMQRLTLSAAMRKMLLPYFADYGMEITEFMVEGITLPERGDLGYDSLQTIIKLHQRKLSETAIETEKALKMAEMEAKKQLDIRQHENAAEVEIAHRGVVSQKGETSVLEAQLEGQRKVAETTADVAAERLRMQLELERKAQVAQIEAEEMRLKGYNQKDVLQAEVMKTFAENPGQGGGMGGVAGVAGDAMRMGMGFAAMGTTMGMAKEAFAPVMGAAAQMGQQTMNSVSGTWDCACGNRGIVGNFCNMCGAKKPVPVPADTWDCVCGNRGIVGSFCNMCGAKRPAPVLPEIWDCTCGQTGITGSFCPNCGSKRG